MTDRYEKIRKALAKRPMQGPWGATLRDLLAERDALAAENEALRAEVERLNRILRRIIEGDGDSTLMIRAGTDAFAAAREYLLRDQEEGNGQ